MRSERELNYLLKVETAKGEVTLSFANIQTAMESIGAANLVTLRDWVRELESQRESEKFERDSLAHVEGLESTKEKFCAICGHVHKFLRICNVRFGLDSRCVCKHQIKISEPETTAELVSRVVDGVSVATSPRMVGNAKRFNTPHAVDHTWTIACHAPPRCKRLEIPMEDEETGADSRKWLPWKLSPDSDPAERWILVSAENDEIEHPDGAKYNTEAQAWIACERESK